MENQAVQFSRSALCSLVLDYRESPTTRSNKLDPAQFSPYIHTFFSPGRAFYICSVEHIEHVVWEPESKGFHRTFPPLIYKYKRHVRVKYKCLTWTSARGNFHLLIFIGAVELQMKLWKEIRWKKVLNNLCDGLAGRWVYWKMFRVR